MKRPNITPGEWYTGTNSGEVFNGDRRKRIVDNSHVPTECSRSDYPELEREANARAIAALPKVLAALEEVQNMGQHIAEALTQVGFHPDNTNRVLDLVRQSLIDAGYTFD